MSLDDQLRAVLREEADLRSAAPPDIDGLISGGRVRRRRRNAIWSGGAVLAAMVAAGSAYGVAQLSEDPAHSKDPITIQPSESQPLALPKTDLLVPLEPGTYLVPAGEDRVAPYTISVPVGWTIEHSATFSKNPNRPGQVGIDDFVLDEVRLTDDACIGPETVGEAQSRVAGLVAALREQQSGPRVSDPVATTVSGLPATRIDLDYPGRRALPGCRLADELGGPRGALQIWTGYFVLFPRETASVYAVEVDGREQLFVTRIRDDASTADRAELQSVLDTITIDTGAR